MSLARWKRYTSPPRTSDIVTSMALAWLPPKCLASVLISARAKTSGFAGDEDGDFAVDGDYVDFVNGVDALDGGYVPVGFYADLYVLEVSAVAGGYVYVEFENAAGVDEAVADYGVFIAEGDGSACGAQVF